MYRYYSLQISGIFSMENYKKNHIVAKTEESAYFKTKTKPILGKQNMHLSNACDDRI